MWHRGINASGRPTDGRGVWPGAGHWRAVALAGLLACSRPNPAFRVDDGSGAVEGGGGDGAVDRGAVDLPTSPSEGGPAEGPQLPDGSPQETWPSDRPPVDQPSVDLPLDAAAPDLPLNPPADVAPPDSVVTSGLVVHYPLDQVAGNAVPDATGTRQGSRTAGATWLGTGFPAARFTNGGCLALDGSTGYVNLPVQGMPAVGANKTLSLWFWLPASDNPFRKVLLTLANATSGFGLHLGLQRGNPSVWLFGQVADDYIVQSPQLAPAGWTHVAYTHQSGTHYLYVNGARVSMDSANYQTAITSLVMLGAYSASTGEVERFSGRIDDVRIYDRGLTAAEVSALASGAF